MSAKTHKGLKKRLKVSAGGKVLRRRIGGRHILSKKSPKRKRRLGQWAKVRTGDLRSFVRQYGKV